MRRRTVATRARATTRIEADKRREPRRGVAPAGRPARRARRSSTSSSGRRQSRRWRRLAFEPARCSTLRDGAARAPVRSRSTSPSQPRAWPSTRCSPLDERSFYIEGWLHHERRLAARLIAVSPGGRERIALDRAAFRYPRPDVDEFYAGAHARSAARTRRVHRLRRDCRAPSLLARGWIARAAPRGGRRLVEDRAAHVVQRLRSLRASDPRRPRARAARSDELTRDHVMPALSRLQERLAPRSRSSDRRVRRRRRTRPRSRSSCRSTGGSTSSSTSSRSSSTTRSCARPTSIYVLDSPERRRRAAAAWRTQLHRLYGVPFRVVDPRRATRGFAAPTTSAPRSPAAGCCCCSTPTCCPTARAGSARCASFYDATPGDRRARPEAALRGRLAPARRPVLRPPAGRRRLGRTSTSSRACTEPPGREHRAAGARRDRRLHDDRPRAVRASSAGCRGIYVQGDYEDSDLCLRLASAGSRTGTCPSVELYHLEAQSYPAAERVASPPSTTPGCTPLSGRDATAELDSDAGRRDPMTRLSDRATDLRRLIMDGLSAPYMSESCQDSRPDRQPLPVGRARRRSARRASERREKAFSTGSTSPAGRCSTSGRTSAS